MGILKTKHLISANLFNFIFARKEKCKYIRSGSKCFLLNLSESVGRRKFYNVLLITIVKIAIPLFNFFSIETKYS